jgi:predicted metal-binding membrane protein
MSETAHDRHFDAAPAVPGRAALFGLLAGRPMAIAAVLAPAALGWGYLALLGAAMGPGGLLDAICWPVLGREGTVPPAVWPAALVLPMWAAMALAMMLPTAAPVMLTYAEIADTAARQGERVISPLVLAAGYAAVWLGFAALAALLQILLARATLLDPAMRPASPAFAGAVCIAAGLYQFSALKHACLARCQRPFPFLFANWSDRAGGVFVLGLRHGGDCLGCCWALMLVMFAAGVMNVGWMAALGLVMALEKLSTTPRLSRAVGLALLAAGIALPLGSMA